MSTSYEQEARAMEGMGRPAPRWQGNRAALLAADVLRLRGTVQIEYTLARLGAEKVCGLMHERGVRPRPRRADRQPGGAAG